MFGSIKSTAFNFVKENFSKVIMLMLPYIVVSLFSGYFSMMGVNSQHIEYATRTTNYFSQVNNILSFVVILLSMIATMQIYKAIYKGDYSNLSLAGSVDGILKVLPAMLVSYLFIFIAVFLLIVVISISLFAIFINPLFVFLFLALLGFMLYLTVRFAIYDVILADLIFNFSGKYSDKQNFNLIEKVIFAFRESWRLTKNQFWFLITLSLSLIGWMFLLIITGGLAVIFVGPYFVAINATLYKHLIDKDYN